MTAPVDPAADLRAALFMTAPDAIQYEPHVTAFSDHRVDNGKAKSGLSAKNQPQMGDKTMPMGVVLLVRAPKPADQVLIGRELRTSEPLLHPALTTASHSSRASRTELARFT